MKVIVTIAAAAGFIALGACNQSATENKADAMKDAAKQLEFERAAALRNRIRALKLKELELKSET